MTRLSLILRNNLTYILIKQKAEYRSHMNIWLEFLEIGLRESTLLFDDANTSLPARRISLMQFSRLYSASNLSDTGFERQRDGVCLFISSQTYCWSCDYKRTFAMGALLSKNGQWLGDP